MSIPRYKINPLFGYLKDAKEGKFCEYRDYLKLEKECSLLRDTISNCMKAVIAREAENARLKAEVERLKEDNRQLTNAFEIAEGIIKRMGKAAEAAAKEGKPSV